MIQEFHRKHPAAYHPLKPLTAQNRGSRLRSLGVTVNDIYRMTTVLQAKAQPKEGVLSRIASILLPPTGQSSPHLTLPHLTS